MSDQDKSRYYESNFDSVSYLNSCGFKEKSYLLRENSFLHKLYKEVCKIGKNPHFIVSLLFNKI